MTRANASFALPPDERLQSAEPSSSLFRPGVELLVRQIGNALNEAQAAFADLMHAEATGDAQAVHVAAVRLAAALACDPKALSKAIAEAVKS